jgi:hypothetical protein
MLVLNSRIRVQVGGECNGGAGCALVAPNGKTVRGLPSRGGRIPDAPARDFTRLAPIAGLRIWGERHGNAVLYGKYSIEAGHPSKGVHRC